ncbi:hypothetical protein Pyn_13079 [Prunus yedoensis var. nudiflora]|uniref:Uncharacterized protein n=1 Tax=Prunus yedoensis var. nudiflora TaxID=2094558 RepID=A0A314YST0_PRUYE|nr:hypothetical protein Pyn_13079 [Prunus yedoensis var. nudiflora]
MSLCFKTTGRQWKVTGHPLSSSKTENLLSNDWSPKDSDRSPEENDQLSPCYQTQEEEIEPFYEILLAPENSSTPVPHQSPTKEVIQKAQSLHISF